MNRKKINGNYLRHVVLTVIYSLITSKANVITNRMSCNNNANGTLLEQKLRQCSQSCTEFTAAFRTCTHLNVIVKFLNYFRIWPLARLRIIFLPTGLDIFVLLKGRNTFRNVQKCKVAITKGSRRDKPALNSMACNVRIPN